MIIYISIGNSDDHLSQSEWAEYVEDVEAAIDFIVDDAMASVHGRWFSLPSAHYQNACWCVDLFEDQHVGSRADALRATLRDLVGKYRQDAIAWAEVKTTEFLGASSG